MPTIKGIEGPYRFHFYSFDCNEPRHVHAERENASCKFWLAPLVLASNDGFSARDLGRIRAVIQQHRDLIIEAWNEHCAST
jgi:hypothetical protein